jgi:hypothetical protein
MTKATKPRNESSATWLVKDGRRECRAGLGWGGVERPASRPVDGPKGCRQVRDHGDGDGHGHGREHLGQDCRDP